MSSSKHYSNISTNKPNRGITRAEAYLARIFPYEYDLEEMLLAYGVKQITETLIELHANLKEGKRYKDRHKNAKKIRERVAA